MWQERVVCETIHKTIAGKQTNTHTNNPKENGPSALSVVSGNQDDNKRSVSKSNFPHACALQTVTERPAFLHEAGTAWLTARSILVHGLSSTGKLAANSTLNRTWAILAEQRPLLSVPAMPPSSLIASYWRQPPVQVILNSVANAVYLPTLFILKLFSLVWCLVVFHYIYLFICLFPGSAEHSTTEIFYFYGLALQVDICMPPTSPFNS